MKYKTAYLNEDNSLPCGKHRKNMEGCIECEVKNPLLFEWNLHSQGCFVLTCFQSE